ncbi:NAD(P)-binding protein [Suillus brevipes Sb2]|nr:NAD(P)-binding protein [Suillus brevipes Sb2]
MPSISDCKCVLVVGSTAGIGRSLALAILDLPSQPTIIVCGRRKERLDELVASHNATGRLKSVTLDVLSERNALKSSIEDIVNTYPDLDAILFSSGIQRAFDFAKPETVDLESLECELATNYTSVVRMITFFLPHLIKLGEQGRPTFLYTVSSGLSIIPAAGIADYCATKSAIHSLSISLAVQLKEKNVHVVEIIPPLVESELHDFEGTTQRLSKFWLSLEEYTKVTMEGLVRGDPYVPAGMVVEQHKKFEEGKLEAATKMYGQLKAMTGK